MDPIIGTWKPYARQAEFLYSPIHSIKENSFATLVISEGGIGQATRKGLFGRTNELSWLKVPDDQGDMYRISIDGGFMVLVTEVEDNEMKAMIVEPKTFGVFQSGIYFKRS